MLSDLCIIPGKRDGYNERDSVQVKGSRCMHADVRSGPHEAMCGFNATLCILVKRYRWLRKRKGQGVRSNSRAASRAP